MRDSVRAFFSRLHREHLKPRRYSKVRHTFSRDMKDYIERIQFQGSSWNDATSPWRFYINLGVQFSDLPERTPARDFPQTHCWTRIEHLVPNAATEYDIPEIDSLDLLAEIASHIEFASRQLAQQIQHVREDYEKTHIPRLTIKA